MKKAYLVTGSITQQKFQSDIKTPNQNDLQAQYQLSVGMCNGFVQIT